MSVLKMSHLDRVAVKLNRVRRRTWRVASDAGKHVLWHTKRGFGRTERKLIDGYLQKHATRKLHIGCGEHMLDGWLNADFYPESPNILHLDITQSFPIPDNTFDYIFSEHVIEHVPYLAGLNMLTECYRILKDQGKIRISTPYLEFLIDLYVNDNKSDIQNRFLERKAGQHRESRMYREGVNFNACFVINEFVRAWGHQFIYDEPTLMETMREAGFVEITKCALNQSSDPVFRDLENESRLPPGMLQMMTITLEAKKQVNASA